MGEKKAITLRDIGLVSARRDRQRGVRPRAGILGCVGRGRFEGTKGDTNVEVREDELDDAEKVGSRLTMFKLYGEMFHSTEAYVCRTSVPHRMVRTLPIGVSMEGSHPNASDQGTLTLLILTLPDSVNRRPTLSQLCKN